MVTTNTKCLLLAVIGVWFFGISGKGYAQTPTVYELRNDIPVTSNGNALSAAWAGGINSPQWNAVDLDNDGDRDLVIFDRVDETLLTFRNGGTAGQVDFSFAPEFMAAFPQDLTAWIRMEDFDGDGHEDIFTNLPGSSNIRVFRNTTGDNNGQLGFGLYADTIYTDYPPYVPLYSARSDLPAVTDVDSDGDLDILTFHLGGRDIEWHRNTSMELHGDLTHLDFVLQSGCFGHVREDIFTCEIIIGLDSCGPGQRYGDPNQLANRRSGMHTGSTLTALDLNGDTLKDLLVGDVDCANITALRNSGTLGIADVDYKEEDFPSNGGTINIPVFPATFHLDLNNDGKRDLIAAPNITIEMEDVRTSAFYLNQGQDDFPDFQLQGYGLLQDEMIETGTGAAPLFFDHNADGLPDLLVGNLGRWDSAGNQLSYLQLYENTGTALSPAFTLLDGNYLNLEGSPLVDFDEYLVPAVADLDADGDPDLLLGRANGQLHHFRNVAAPGDPAQFTYVTGNYAGIDAGLYSAPELYDLDRDGDFDLLLGHHRGWVQYYENTGTAAAASFVKVTDSLGRFKRNDFFGSPFGNGFARPRVDDVDLDGDPELLVGGVDGTVEVFDDVDLVPGSVFRSKGMLFDADVGGYACVAVGLLNNGEKSYVIGTERGGLVLYRNTGVTVAGGPGISDQPKLEVFPNPASNRSSVRIRGLASAKGLQLELWDVTGRLLRAQPMSGPSGEIDLQGIAQGMYIVRVQGADLRLSKRLLVQN